MDRGGQPLGTAATRVWRSIALIAALALLGGCGEAGGDDAGEGQRGHSGEGGGDTSSTSSTPCPACRPRAGGETSDFGSQAACALALERRLISAEEASELGFDVETAQARIERPIDAPLRWEPQETEGGGPAGGYEAETRVRAQLTVRSYVYDRPDPARCDGEICLIEEQGETIEVGQDGCEETLFVGADMELETLDGALSFSITDDPDAIGHDTAVVLRLDRELDDGLGGGPGVDLARVQGSLTISPDVPEPYVGTVWLSLDYLPEGTAGVISIGITPDWDNLDANAGGEIPPELAYYAPLRGSWPASEAADGD